MATSLVQGSVAPAVEQALIGGDLSKLNPEDRLSLYRAVCDSLGLNPLTNPFRYINLNGRLVLYALKDCTDQLRSVHRISLQIPARELIDGVYIVTARASRPDGRCDESTGAVPVENLKGEAKANAMMKAETKAKRRVTLSICGLGMLDESEIESIPGAAVEGARQTAENGRKAAAEVRDRKLKEIGEAKQSCEVVADPEVAHLWQQMGSNKKDIRETIESFRQVFARLCGGSAGDLEYRRILAWHGVEPESPTSVQAARNCVSEMWTRAKELKKALRDHPATEPEPVVPDPAMVA